MPQLNTQIQPYLNQSGPKEHERTMLQLIKDTVGKDNSELSFLDIGCASGSFLKLLSKNYPFAAKTGFDLSKDLIDIAKSTSADTNISFVEGDALNFKPDRPYKIAIASGVLSIFDDATAVLDKWLDWLEDEGFLFVFGRFNAADIDTRIYFRRPDEEWQSGLTAYSIKAIEDHLNLRGCNVEFKRFILPFDLPKSDDPLKTYTVNTQEGEKIIVSGANIIAEHYHVIIQKSTN